MRLVDVLTQNPVQSGDPLIQSSKSRELVRFLPQVSILRNEIISFDELGLKVGVNCRNATTVFHSMTISLQRCIEVTIHNLQVTGQDVGYQRRDAVVKIDGFFCIGQRD